jgi:hypothetical protein
MMWVGQSMISVSICLKGMPLAVLLPLIDSNTQQTGVPWNTRYKPTHGTIRDFVESKQHFFYVKDAVVSVVEGATWNENPPPTQRAPVPPSPAPAASAWAGGSGGGGSASPKSWAQLAAKPAPAECTEKCWFDFNDMTITPVSVRELEKYCEGSECAYVLFYRRKSATMDSASAKKVMPNLPPHMQGEIDEFNMCLQSSRVMYAERMSQVKVTLGSAVGAAERKRAEAGDDAGRAHLTAVDSDSDPEDSCQKFLRVRDQHSKKRLGSDDSPQKLASPQSPSPSRVASRVAPASSGRSDNSRRNTESTPKESESESLTESRAERWVRDQTTPVKLSIAQRKH